MANQRPLALKSASSRRAPECDDGRMLAAFHAAELELDTDFQSAAPPAFASWACSARMRVRAGLCESVGTRCPNDGIPREMTG